MLLGEMLSGESQDSANACGPRKMPPATSEATKAAHRQAIAPSTSAPALQGAPGGDSEGRKQGAGPRQFRCISVRNNFIEPRFLNLPVHRKVLNH